MNYEGKLYGKFGRRFIPLTLTSVEVDGQSQKIAEQAAQIVALRKAQSNFRDTVLNERGLLSEENAPVNAILKELDDAFGDALFYSPPPVVPLADVSPLVRALENCGEIYNDESQQAKALSAFTTKYPQP